jgi:hypothetical protein
VVDYGRLDSGLHPHNRARTPGRHRCRGDLHMEGCRHRGDLIQLEGRGDLLQLEGRHHRGGHGGHTSDLRPRQLRYESNLKLYSLLMFL